MFRNTTLMVWYIGILMVLGAGLGHGGISSNLDGVKADALGSQSSFQYSIATESAPAQGREVRIFIDGTEYRARLLEPISPTVSNPILTF